MPKTTYLANKVLGHTLGIASYTMPTCYLALFTVAPTISGGGTEDNYTGYARVALSGLMGTPSSESVSNTSAVTFGADTSGTNTEVDFGVFDASTAGNLLWFGTATLSVSPGITPQFAIGALTFTDS